MHAKAGWTGIIENTVCVNFEISVESRCNVKICWRANDKHDKELNPRMR